MTKQEFLSQLASLLSDISFEEREEALSYYREYIEDAGLENEEAILNELGSPQKVAADIKKDIYQRTSYTSDGTPDSMSASNATYTNTQNAAQQQKKSNANLILVLIIAVLLAPIWIPLGIAAVSVIFSAIISILSIGLGLGIAGIALLIAGVVVFAIGICNLFLSPFTGLLLIGISLILFALGIFFTLFTGWVCVKVFPWIIKQLSILWNRITPPGKGAQS